MDRMMEALSGPILILAISASLLIGLGGIIVAVLGVLGVIG